MAGPLNIMSYGENYYKGGADAKKSIHAEDQAMRKLPVFQGRRPKKIDLLVIRVNRSLAFGNSKPCIHCLWLLMEKLPQMGYALGRIYYSDEHGQLIITTLHALAADENPHVSKYYKDRNYQPRNKNRI